MTEDRISDRDYLALVRKTFAPDPRAPAAEHPLAYCMMGLAGEAGEVANRGQKMMRGDYSEDMLKAPAAFEGEKHLQAAEQRKKLVSELGGVCWYLFAVCDQLGISVRDAMTYNATVLESRLARGTIQGDGDDR